MLGDAGLSEELNNVAEKINEYGQNLAELHHSFTRHCTAVMGDAGISVDVEDLKSRVTHLEKEVQDLHVKVDNVSTLMRQVLGEFASIRRASSDTLATQLMGPIECTRDAFRELQHQLWPENKAFYCRIQQDDDMCNKGCSGRQMQALTLMIRLQVRKQSVIAMADEVTICSMMADIITHNMVLLEI